MKTETAVAATRDMPEVGILLDTPPPPAIIVELINLEMISIFDIFYRPFCKSTFFCDMFCNKISIHQFGQMLMCC